MQPTSLDDLSRSADLKVRKLLGRSYLRDNRLDAALDVYQALAIEYPGDVDVLVVLGNLYLLAGWPAHAEAVYRRAQSLSPNNLLVYKQLTLAQSDGAAQAALETDPLAEESILRLRERLREIQSTEQTSDLRGAADMLERILPDEQKSDPNGLPGESLQLLMPALIDLNIRQARAAGRSDVAEALQSLQISLSRQTGALKGSPPLEQP